MATLPEAWSLGVLLHSLRFGYAGYRTRALVLQRPMPAAAFGGSANLRCSRLGRSTAARQAASARRPCCSFSQYWRIVAAHFVTSVLPDPLQAGRTTPSLDVTTLAFQCSPCRRHDCALQLRLRHARRGRRYAASSLRLCLFLSCGSRKRLRIRTTLGVTSTSSSSWM